MSDMPIRCEYCGKEIDEIISVDGYFIEEFPALLHSKCYRDLSEKAWLYDQLET